MLDAMKQLKIMPCGRCSPFGLSAGVHCHRKCEKSRQAKIHQRPLQQKCRPLASGHADADQLA